VLLQEPDHIGYQVPPALAPVMARDVVMHVAVDALQRAGARTVGRLKHQLKAGMLCKPALHFLGFVDFIVVPHDLDLVIALGGIDLIELSQQIDKQAGPLFLPEAVLYTPRAPVPSSGPVAFLILAGGDNLGLRAFLPPLVAALGQQVPIQFIGPQHRWAWS
jgi:hypothetical protein